MVPQSVRYGNIPSLAGWPAGAAAREPAVVGPLSFRNFPVSEQRNIPPAEVYGVAMVHGFKVPSGQERLVYVLVEGKIDLEGLTQYALGRGSESAAQPVEGQLGKSLRLVAVPCRPAQGTKPPLQLTDDATSLVLVSGGNSPWRVGWKWVARPDGKGGEVRLDAKDQFRFYAGQPDPNDPSHFTIDYDLDGKRGRIHGRLKDDGKVEWQPEAGTVTGKYWDFD
jgi:hypothetical protein